MAERADAGYQHTIPMTRQHETRCGKGVPDRRGSTPPEVNRLPKCPGCFPAAASKQAS